VGLIRLSPRAAVLLTGDLAALLLFVIMGRESHDEGNAIAGVLGAVWPFIVAWLVVTPLVGALRPRHTAALVPMIRVTLLTWAAALPIAIVLRALALGRWSPWTFYLVALIVITVLLLGWRVAFVLLAQRRGRVARVTGGPPR